MPKKNVAAMSLLRRFSSTIWEIAVKIAGRGPWIVDGFIYKVAYLKALPKRGFVSPRIVTYPDRPRPYHMLYKMTHVLGYRLTTDLRANAVAYVAFEDATVKERPDKLELAAIRPVINIDCNDISKKHVAAVFEKVFGYTLTVDPCTYTGTCVKKSDFNGTHDGMIVNCPIPKENEDPDCIYQRMVTCRVPGSDLLTEMRVPIFNDRIPCVRLKYRDPTSPFHYTVGIETADVDDVLSPEEVDKTLAVCRELGLTLGELDVLRDSDDGRIYILDVNNTPSGPAGLNRREGKSVVETMAVVFERTFVQASTR